MKTRRNNCNYTHTRCKQSQHASSGLMIRGWLAWGSTNTPGRSGKRSRKDLPETVLSQRGCLRTREKWSFSIYQTIVKRTGTERARRDEDMGVGFTSIGVTIVEIRRVEVQGPMSEKISANSPLEEKLNAYFLKYVFGQGKRLAVGALPL